MSHDNAASARTSVACARVGSLTTYSRRDVTRLETPVSVAARADGSVEIELARHAAAGQRLLARPVATLRVAPTSCDAVLIHASAHRLPRLGGAGSLVFLLQVAAVRVGAQALLIDSATYHATPPDPLRHDAPQVLAHLNVFHADALAACLRAGGHDAQFAAATRLDARGLTVAAVQGSGVEDVRLTFPTPIRALHELPPSLRRVLTPHCGCIETLGRWATQGTS